MSSNKVIVTIPTYNERENIEKLIYDIRQLDKNFGIVVADDDSPDKTWELVEKIEKNDPNVYLLRRFEKKGRGFAGKDAFKFALLKQADYIIEMDADFSHDPKYIPALLEKAKEYDLVIGSRFVAGGEDIGRTIVRRLLTKISNFYVRLILGIPVKDCNSGYRCFRREVLEKISLDTIFSEGPSIVHELLYKSYICGFKICEVPIKFVERKKGSSTLNLKKLLNGYLMILKLKFLKIAGKLL